MYVLNAHTLVQTVNSYQLQTRLNVKDVLTLTYLITLKMGPTPMEPVKLVLKHIPIVQNVNQIQHMFVKHVREIKFIWLIILIITVNYVRLTLRIVLNANIKVVYLPMELNALNVMMGLFLQIRELETMILAIFVVEKSLVVSLATLMPLNVKLVK